MKEIFTDNHELDQVQQAVKEALADLQELLSYPLGKPTKAVRSRYVAKVGEAVMADPTEAAFSIVLQAADAGSVGKLITVKNNSASTNTITIVAARSGTIDGAASVTITAAWGTATFQIVAVDEYITL